MCAKAISAWHSSAQGRAVFWFVKYSVSSSRVAGWSLWQREEQKKKELSTFFGTYFHFKGSPGKSTWEAEPWLRLVKGWTCSFISLRSSFNSRKIIWFFSCLRNRGGGLWSSTPSMHAVCVGLSLCFIYIWIGMGKACFLGQLWRAASDLWVSKVHIYRNLINTGQDVSNQKQETYLYHFFLSYEQLDNADIKS